MLQRLRKSSKAAIASVLTAIYLALLVSMAIAHHRPSHNPTPTACVVSQGKAPEKNPHCRPSPSPSPTTAITSTGTDGSPSENANKSGGGGRGRKGR